jgi:SET domain-containing protein
MLLVKCEARPSSIHGLGLFACEDIPAGTAVASWTEGSDYCLTVDQFKVLPVELKEFLWNFVWTWIDGNIYGTADAGRFTNRSDTPNMRWDDETRTPYAIDDIKAGTELTEDYDEFDHSEEMP